MEKILRELQKDFIEDLPNALDAIITSHISQDMDALFQAVHRLKGAAAVCQYDEIAALSENYCEALREQRYDDLDHCHAELILACSEIQA
ncbi:MAG: Hpt domain-containing protein [Gammaproteobacteria bacterium]|jgi:HPt (histidine-containing phosphotransfer) domain-containing protein